MGWPRTSPIPSWQLWSQKEPITWTYAAGTLWTPSLYSKLEPWRSPSWRSGLKRPGTATEVVLQQLWPLHLSWLRWSRTRPCDMVTGAFPPCFLTCTVVVTIACVHERGRQQMDGEHSQMINSSQNAWIELPALVCFPLLLFSNAVLYYTIMGSCYRLVALLTVLSDRSNWWCIQQWITWECCWWWNSCCLQCDWISDIFCCGDNVGTEITSYCDVWWRDREGLEKLAVLFVRKLNSPYPLELVLEKK